MTKYLVEHVVGSDDDSHVVRCMNWKKPNKRLL